MVDRIVEAADKTTVTAFLICEENIFCENGKFCEPGLIENIAQTAAAGVGNKPGNSAEQAPVGFIGGIKNLKICGFPMVGQEIITRVTVLHEIFDATIVQGEVFLNDRLIAGCELKIFVIK